MSGKTRPVRADSQRKVLFVTLRYLFIVTASCLLIYQLPDRSLEPSQAVMVVIALTSNAILCFVQPETLFAWYVEAPVLIADTLWVSWALHSTGAIGGEFFLLYFFVLFLAGTGESLLMVLLGSTFVSAANVYFVWGTAVWPSALLLRIVFFYFVALFYGHVLSQIRHERQRADKGIAWARELEAKVTERTAELRRLYEESLAASRAKSEFVANMSHELRTPLHIILGYAEMLLDRPGKAEREGIVGRVREAAVGLLQLVDSVLDLGKLESGRMPVSNEPVPLDRFVGELQLTEHIPTAPDVALVWRVAPELPVVVTDPGKLAVVLNNLINNAIKFTQRGTITVSARDMGSEERVEFRVDDTGPGIPEGHLKTIFEPFHQEAGVGGNPYGGVGLGLAIVERHAELLGAEVSVRSAIGVGTTFTLRLPYRRTAAASAA